MTAGPLFPIFDWQRALRDSELPKETKLIGWVVSTYTNKHGENAHPGEALLAETLGFKTHRAVRSHLARLREDGWLERYVRGATAGHRNWADVYRLTFPTTGSELPEVDVWDTDPWDGTEADHRKSNDRPPEFERHDHRKQVAAQLRMTSTHPYKAPAPSGAASRTSARGDGDPLGYADPSVSDSDRIGIVTEHLGDYLGPGDEPLIESMVMQGRPLPAIVNAVTAGCGEPAA